MNFKKYTIFLVFLFSLLIRTIYLGKVPVGVTNDEANVAYDTFLLTQTGKDQWGKSWPFEFKGFGDYRLPVYQYLLYPLVKFLGIDAWVIRLPIAIFSSLTIILLYYFVLLLFKDYKHKHKLALISALVLTINPWHFGMSRWIMESNLALFFSLLAVFLFLRKQKYDWLLSTIFFVLAIYTYYGARFFLPLLFFYLMVTKKWSKKELINYIGVIIILCLPLLINNFLGGGFSRIRQVNLTHDLGLVGQVERYREACLHFDLFKIGPNYRVLIQYVCMGFFNKPVFWLRQFVLNYLNHFSFAFLFFEKLEQGWQFLPPHSFFYFFNIPFLIMGLFSIFSKYRKQAWLLIIWLLVSPLADSITGQGHYARSLTMLIPIVIFTAFGYLNTFGYLKHLKLKKIILGTSLVFAGFFVLMFFIKYFTVLPFSQSKYSHYEYKPLFSYLKQIEDDYEQIYISRKVRDTKQYIFYLYYNKIPAKEFFKLHMIREDGTDGWVKVGRLGKYWFLDDVNQVKKYPPQSLLVVAPEEYDQGGDLQRIYYIDGEEAFRIFKTNDLFY